MRKNIAVGLDIGTYQIKVVVAEESEKGQLPNVIGIGKAESKGLRHGYIINQEESIQSVRKAIKQAEKSSGIKIKEVFLSLGGIGLSSVVSSGSVIISRSDLEITNLDTEKAVAEAEKLVPQSASINRKNIHTIPLSYKIDGKQVYGNPIGMKGAKLEAKVIFISYLEHHLNEVFNAISACGLKVVDAMASPIASSLVTLSQTERRAGCVLANIGSETVSIVVYEDGKPISLEVFPIGASDITNDIALGFCISLDEAEKIKRGSELEKIKSSNSNKKKIDEIISARLSDIFELINAHLKKIGRNGLLPAGIVLTGGGSGITTIEDMAKVALNLPSKISHYSFGNQADEKIDLKIKDASWSVAYGLCVLGLDYDSGGILIPDSTIKPIFKNLINWVRQFLP